MRRGSFVSHHMRKTAIGKISNNEAKYNRQFAYGVIIVWQQQQEAVRLRKFAEYVCVLFAHLKMLRLPSRGRWKKTGFKKVRILCILRNLRTVFKFKKSISFSVVVGYSEMGRSAE